MGERPRSRISSRRCTAASSVHRIARRGRATAGSTPCPSRLYAANGAYAPWPYSAALDSGQASENVTGPYDIPSLRAQRARGGHEQGADGPVPRRRARDRLPVDGGGDGRAGRAARPRPARDQAPQPRAQLPARHGRGARLRERRLRAAWSTCSRAPSTGGACGPRTSALRAEGRYRGVGVALASSTPRTGRSRSASRKLEHRRSATTRRPCGWSRTGRCASRSDCTTTARATRRRSRRSPPTSSASRRATSRSSTATPSVVPYGLGTWASRSTVCSRRRDDPRRARGQGRRSCGSRRHARGERDDLELADGPGPVRGTPSRGVSCRATWRDARRHEPHLLPAGEEPGLEVTRRFVPPDPGTLRQLRARRARRGRRRDRRGADPALRGRRGLRHDRQPDDRRGTGARRRRPGHRRRAATSTSSTTRPASS